MLFSLFLYIMQTIKSILSKHKTIPLPPLKISFTLFRKVLLNSCLSQTGITATALLYKY